MRLKKIRKSKGVRQHEIASAIGVSIPTISHWELGRCRPSVVHLRKLADFLGVTVDELLKEDEEDRRSTKMPKATKVTNKSELEAMLRAEIAEGKISADEAEHEWQNFVNPEPRYCGQEW